MNRVIAGAILIAALIGACNLSTNPPTPTAPLDTATAPPLPFAETPSGTLAPPTQVLTPSAATRTPFGLMPTGITLQAPGQATLQPLGQRTPLATTISGERAVIASPQDGASVSAGTLQVSGSVFNLPEDAFTLTLEEATGQVINSQRITLQNPNRVSEVPWSAAMTTGTYRGPARITITGRTGDGIEALLAAIDIILTEGSAPAVINPGPVTAGSPSGSITSPLANGTASGNPLQVSGMAGGLPENQFTLALIAPSGAVLNSQAITLTNAEANLVPWSAALGTGGYTGPAEIRASASSGPNAITFASINITLR